MQRNNTWRSRRLAFLRTEKMSGKCVKDRAAYRYFLNIYQCSFGEYHIEREFFEKARHLSSTQGSEKWLARLTFMNGRALLAHECYVYCVFVNRSLINPAFSDIRCFAHQAFTEGETVGYYYGTLVY